MNIHAVDVQVALRAARLACETNPTSAVAWNSRIALEAAAVAAATGAKAGSSSSNLLELIKQGLQQVPAAEAEQLWQQVGTNCNKL